MDIRAKIEELTDKVKNDPDFGSKFQSNPVGAVESLLGVDLPEDQIKQIAEAVKTKVNIDRLGGVFGGIFGKK